MLVREEHTSPFQPPRRAQKLRLPGRLGGEGGVDLRRLDTQVTSVTRCSSFININRGMFTVRLQPVYYSTTSNPTTSPTSLEVRTSPQKRNLQNERSQLLHKKLLWSVCITKCNLIECLPCCIIYHPESKSMYIFSSGNIRGGVLIRDGNEITISTRKKTRFLR